MAPHIETDELPAAWRALAGSHEGEGWQTITVATGNPCRILAGIHHPGREESLLVGFRQVPPRPASGLPGGNGFLVRPAELASSPDGLTWFSLVRQPAGSLDMFTMMAADVLGVLDANAGLSQEGLLQLFLRRIRAWQSFMLRSTDGVLDPEAEVGLVGELVMLGMLLDSGLSPRMAIDGWNGPMDGLQDFAFEGGSIEVKATLAKGRFPVTINSLDQLDESQLIHLFLTGVRLATDAHGASLPDLVDGIRTTLQADTEALARFDFKLVHAGYLDRLSASYTRKFAVTEQRVFPVVEGFPKLCRGTVATGITEARYHLDLDLVSGPTEELDRALQILGVI